MPTKALSARHGVQGIPAVKAFRDGEVVDEFVGAVPRAKVEAFFDSLVPSKAEELLAKGDELSLREAAELEPRRADIAVALARVRLQRGAEEEALSAVEAHETDFAAQGIVARVRLAKQGKGADAFSAARSRRARRRRRCARLDGRWAGRKRRSASSCRQAIVGLLSDLAELDPRLGPRPPPQARDGAVLSDCQQIRPRGNICSPG